MTRQALLHNKSIQKVTYVGMVVNIGLAILKIVFGLLVSSVSLVADGFHSL
ncbi:MAG: cation transporter, partial [Planctomycetota bacterium]